MCETAHIDHPPLLGLLQGVRDKRLRAGSDKLHRPGDEDGWIIPSAPLPKNFQGVYLRLSLSVSLADVATN